MNCPFALIIPGYPMITDFQQVDNTKFVTVLPNPSQITEICFSVSPNVNIPAGGLAIYYSFNEQDGWSILGTVTPNLPSGFFRTGWGTMNVENYQYVQVGISMESCDFVNNLQGVIQTPIERELPIMKVAQDVYNYVTSFATSGNSITVPLNFMEKWLDKTKKKLEKDPNYFYKYVCLFQTSHSFLLFFERFLFFAACFACSSISFSFFSISFFSFFLIFFSCFLVSFSSFSSLFRRFCTMDLNFPILSLETLHSCSRYGANFFMDTNWRNSLSSAEMISSEERP